MERKSFTQKEQWIALALCILVLIAGALEQFISNRLTYADTFAPLWIPIAAAVFAAAGIVQMNRNPQWLRVQATLRWMGLLLMVWAANGLPFDLLRMTPLIPLGVDWPGMVTRMLALAAFVVLAHLTLAYPATPVSSRAGSWYGYAAFVLALPYPVLRVCWAFGGTLGLMYPGAGGSGFAPLVLAIPWLLAAVLSLLLVSKRRLISRRLLLTAGWTATTIVAMIGPAACWSIVTRLFVEGETVTVGIAKWVFCLFYGSWFLWAIVACAATRSYQLRTVSSSDVPSNVKVGSGLQ
jgi:hypothetical protein